MQQRTGLLVLVLATLVTARLASAQQSEVDSKARRLDKSIFLIRDPAVQTELRLSQDQKDAVGRLVAQVNEPLFHLRDLSPEKAIEAAQPLAPNIYETLETILDPAQRQRLQQIVLRVNGLSDIVRPDWSAELGLDERQRQKIRTISEQVQARLLKLASEPQSTGTPDAIKKQAQQYQIDEYRRIVATLTAEQKSRLVALLGEKFDLSRLRPIVHQAPELRDVDEWINSEPQSLEQLRGKVVALHFWTFG